MRLVAKRFVEERNSIRGHASFDGGGAWAVAMSDSREAVHEPVIGVAGARAGTSSLSRGPALGVSSRVAVRGPSFNVGVDVLRGPFMRIHEGICNLICGPRLFCVHCIARIPNELCLFMGIHEAVEANS